MCFDDLIVFKRVLQGFIGFYLGLWGFFEGARV